MVEWYIVVQLDTKFCEITLSPMSQSVTSTNLIPFGPAVSEQSLRSLKETDGSDHSGIDAGRKERISSTLIQAL